MSRNNNAFNITLKRDLTRKNTVRSQGIVEGLQAGLQGSNARVLDLFRAWDTDGDGKISREEFRAAFRSMAPSYSQRLVDDCFDCFDPNGDHVIEFSELDEQLRRRAEAGSSPAAGVGDSRTKALDAIQAVANEHASSGGGGGDECLIIIM